MKYSLSKNSGSGAESGGALQMCRVEASDGKQVMCLMQNDRGTIQFDTFLVCMMNVCDTAAEHFQCSNTSASVL